MELAVLKEHFPKDNACLAGAINEHVTEWQQLFLKSISRVFLATKILFGFSISFPRYLCFFFSKNSCPTEVLDLHNKQQKTYQTTPQTEEK